MKYYINGWIESRNYFMRLGRFTAYELNDLMNGKIVTKNGNDFWIVPKDEH